MNNLNSVLIEGNMVRDPLIRTIPNGKQVCNFSIASNRYYRQDSNLEKETGFFDIEAWGKLVDACSSQGRKGRGVRVVGRLKQDRWTGSDGKSHNKVSIVAEHVEYRADFKKETAQEAENMAGIFDGDFDANREQRDVSRLPDGNHRGFGQGAEGTRRDYNKKYAEAEELQAVAF